MIFRSKLPWRSLNICFRTAMSPIVALPRRRAGAGSRSEFYVEATERDRMRTPSRDASNVVLTQFEKVEDTSRPRNVECVPCP